MDTKVIATDNGEIGVICHEGKEYAAGGGFVTAERATVYLGENGQITLWSGKPVGTYKITKTWRTPRSFVSSMSQVYAWIDGRQYTGRSAGVGMVCNLRKVRR